ncbi:Serpin E3 [Varanus komodoensis]|nr:Serpin E3 [Varanus komodoensis]
MIQQSLRLEHTFAQLKQALEYSTHDQDTRDFLHAAYEEMANPSQGPTAQLACAVFVQAGVPLSPQCAQHAAFWTNNTVQQTNFSEPNSSAAQINEWIATSIGDGETRSLSLETADSSLSQVAVVSTTHFKSTWQRKFAFRDTQPLPFTMTDGHHPESAYNVSQCRCQLCPRDSQESPPTPQFKGLNSLALSLPYGPTHPKAKVIFLAKKCRSMIKTFLRIPDGLSGTDQCGGIALPQGDSQYVCTASI